MVPSDEEICTQSYRDLGFAYPSSGSGGARGLKSGGQFDSSRAEQSRAEQSRAPTAGFAAQGRIGRCRRTRVGAALF